MKNVILMVDDNTEMRQVFAEALAKLEFRVITFENVKRAQQYLEDTQIPVKLRPSFQTL